MQVKLLAFAEQMPFMPHGLDMHGLMYVSQLEK
jgi:hypothetical protein